MANCPCGRAITYAECCGKYIDSKATPPTPETLMRSRYTAFTQSNIEYIQQTMRPPASLDFDENAAKEWSSSVTWLGLEVISSSENGNSGQVEFRALFKTGNEHRLMQERSLFTKAEDGRWYYIDGEAPQKTVRVTHVGRNDPCLCGSGKKSKKCCGQT